MLYVIIFLFICLLAELILYFYSVYWYQQFSKFGAYPKSAALQANALDMQNTLMDLEAKCAFSEIAIQVLQQKNAQLIAEHQVKVQDYLAEAALLNKSITQVENLFWEKNQQIRCKAIVLHAIAAQLVDWNDNFDAVFQTRAPTLKLGRDHNRIVKEIIVQTVNAGIRVANTPDNHGLSFVPEALQKSIPKFEAQFEKVNALTFPQTEKFNPSGFQNIQINGAQLVNAIQSIIAELKQHRKLQSLSN